jgi:hypothetical protein
MIKTNFKSIAPAVATLVMGATLLAPAVFADTTATTTPIVTPTVATQTAPKSCNIYSVKAVNAAIKIADYQAKFDANQANIISKMDVNRANNDKRLADSRLTADQKRADAIAKLNGKNLTDAEKAAVAAFQATVNQAVSTRRSAIDAAITAYRTSLDQALAGRVNNVDEATSTYATAVQAAYAKAYSDCQAKVSSKTIRTNLNAALKSARQAFTANRQTLTKLQSIIAPLAKTRQQAITAAESAFKSAITAATATLKAAFPAKTTKK